MTIKIKHKRGTASAVASANPTPAAGELVFETDTRRFKLGDGSTAYTSLSYVAPNAGDITSGTLDIARIPTGSTSSTVCIGNDARLSDTRTPTDNTVSTAKIQNDAVTYAKIQNVSATDRLLGRSSSGAGDVEEITCTAFGRSLIDDADAAAARTTLSVQPTASPTFTGSVGIGNAAGGNSRLNINGTYTSSTVDCLPVHCNGTIPSTTVSPGEAQIFRSAVSTEAASFTLPNWTHYYANQGTIGAGSSVTNQFGFRAAGGIIGATNNYGFYSDIASGSGRWNFYANGTAQNYFGGQVLVTAGSVSACSVAPSGDPNTGLVFPSADVVTLITNGSERMRVKSTGSVRFLPLASDPASGNEAGDVYYNSTTNKLKVYNGTSWVDLH